MSSRFTIFASLFVLLASARTVAATIDEPPVGVPPPVTAPPEVKDPIYETYPDLAQALKDRLVADLEGYYEARADGATTAYICGLRLVNPRYGWCAVGFNWCKDDENGNPVEVPLGNDPKDVITPDNPDGTVVDPSSPDHIDNGVAVFLDNDKCLELHESLRDKYLDDYDIVDD